MLTADELLKANPSAIERWLEQYAELDSVLALLFMVLGEGELYADMRFLLVVQAVEAFHRATSTNRLVSEAEHRTLQKALIAALPPGTAPQMREKLTGTLQFVNEPSLRQRLLALTAGLAERFGTAPPGLSKAAISAIVDTRNYNTHHTPALKARALGGADMHWTARRLLAILTVLLFERLGLAPDVVTTHLARHREFAQLWASAGTPR